MAEELPDFVPLPVQSPSTLSSSDSHKLIPSTQSSEDSVRVLSTMSEQPDQKIPDSPLPILEMPPPTFGKAIQLSVGSEAARGKRATMEDKASLLQHPLFSAQCKLPVDNNVPRSFFAVYDGHGGEVCAEYCRRYLHGNMVIQDSFKRGDSVTALKDAVLATERNFVDAAKKANLENTSGTCAIIAYLEGDNLIVANVGDSRAVLSRKGKALALSTDHKPSRPDERKRIEDRGGAVARADREALNPPSALCDWLSTTCCCPCMYIGPLRVYPGGLAVSRSIGDVGLKTNGLVVADPEMTIHKITEEDEFLILACDGIWDVLTNQQAVTVVSECLKAGRDPNQASTTLTQTAIQRGSMDNCSVIVVVFSEDPMYARTATNTSTVSSAPLTRATTGSNRV